QNLSPPRSPAPACCSSSRATTGPSYGAHLRAPVPARRPARPRLGRAGARPRGRGRLLAAPGRALPLRRLQSGHVGDYVAWLLVGTSLLGALALPGVLGN
ncbi:hypothetical protein, partial [Streptomyces sp. NRRL S-146]|uniref:hypothetical protein n=1 Tax=Streptomyces sp. NRRL S-146 TaxID=1463884 RepID=UPI002277B7B5